MQKRMMKLEYGLIPTGQKLSADTGIWYDDKEEAIAEGHRLAQVAKKNMELVVKQTNISIEVYSTNVQMATVKNSWES